MFARPTRAAPSGAARLLSWSARTRPRPTPRRTVGRRIAPRAGRLLAAVLTLAALHAFATAQDPAGLALPGLAPSDTLVTVHVGGGGASFPALAAAASGIDLGAARRAAARLLRAWTPSDAPAAASALADALAGGADARHWLDARCPATAGLPLPRLDGALVALAASPPVPLPRVLAALRLAPGQGAAAEALRDALVSCLAAGPPQDQDGTRLDVLDPGADGTVALAHVDDVWLVANGVDALRSAVRLAHGSPEGSLAGAAPDLSDLLEGPGIALAVRRSALANLLAMVPARAAGATRAAALQELDGALRTAPWTAFRILPGDAGVTLETRTRIDAQRGDPALAALLRCDGCTLPLPLLAPSGSAAVSVRPLRARAWSEYLIAAVEAAAGADGSTPDARRALADEAGIDLERDVLGWLGDSVTQVVVDAPGGAPGVPGAAWIVPVASEAAARTGLERLGRALSPVVGRPAADALDTDPADLVVTTHEVYRGIDLVRLRVGPTLDVSIAVVGNRLVLGTAVRAVIDTYLGGRSAVEDAAFRAAWALRPPGAYAFGVSDAPRMAAGAADVLAALGQPLAFGAWAALREEEGRHGGDTGDGGFADLLALVDAPVEALRAFSATSGPAVSWSWTEDDARGAVAIRRTVIPLR